MERGSPLRRWLAESEPWRTLAKGLRGAGVGARPRSGRAVRAGAHRAAGQAHRLRGRTQPRVGDVGRSLCPGGAADGLSGLLARSDARHRSAVRRRRPRRVARPLVQLPAHAGAAHRAQLRPAPKRARRGDDERPSRRRRPQQLERPGGRRLPGPRGGERPRGDGRVPSGDRRRDRPGGLPGRGRERPGVQGAAGLRGRRHVRRQRGSRRDSRFATGPLAPVRLRPAPARARDRFPRELGPRRRHERCASQEDGRGARTVQPALHSRRPGRGGLAPRHARRRGASRGGSRRGGLGGAPASRGRGRPDGRGFGAGGARSRRPLRRGERPARAGWRGGLCGGGWPRSRAPRRSLADVCPRSCCGNQVPETRALARLARDEGAIAASAFGGGFGGAVWAVVEAGEAADFVDRWRGAYAASFAEPAEAGRFFISPPGRGAHWLDGDLEEEGRP